MSLPPMDRDTLRSLKTDTDESVRRAKVNDIVKYIYAGVVEQAKISTDTFYYLSLPSYNDKKQFYVLNMGEILNDLDFLFPQCYVAHTLLARGTNGKLYDISRLDDSILPLVNDPLPNSYIVVDWS